jgi:hypothetical protein
MYIRDDPDLRSIPNQAFGMKYDMWGKTIEHINGALGIVDLEFVHPPWVASSLSLSHSSAVNRPSSRAVFPICRLSLTKGRCSEVHITAYLLRSKVSPRYERVGETRGSSRLPVPILPIIQSRVAGSSSNRERIIRNTVTAECAQRYLYAGLST